MATFELADIKNGPAVITLIFTDKDFESIYEQNPNPIYGIDIIYDPIINNQSEHMTSEQNINHMIDNRQNIEKIIEVSDMLFILVGASDVTRVKHAIDISIVSKELGIVTIVIASMPFQWEDKKYYDYAEKNILQLKKIADTVLVIPSYTEQTDLSLEDVLVYKQKLSIEAVRSITELITTRGLICIDFSDVRAATSHMGEAMMGTGSSQDCDRAYKATQIALEAATIDQMELSTSKGILVTITAGMDLGIGEFEEVAENVNKVTHPDAIVVVGTVMEPEMEDELRVTIVATGIGELNKTVNQLKTNESATLNQSKELPSDLTYLDIPAFLRRQND